MHILGRERLHQATERQVGHWKVGRATGNEKTRNVEIAHPDGDGETGRAMRKPQVDQCQIRHMFFRGGDRGLETAAGGHHAIARVVLNQVFQRCRQLRVVFDDQDLQHRQASPPPAKVNPCLETDSA